MKREIDGSTLKIIALVTMLIDHIGFRFISEMIDMGMFPSSGTGRIVYEAFRFIGRIAFVLFAFMLVEGFVHTSSRPRYILRLSVAAVMSELPFDLFGSGTGDMLAQNVIFTLLIGFLVLWGLEILLDKRKKAASEQNKGKTFAFGLLSVLIVCAGMLLAEALRTDYSSMGVALIVAFWIFRGRNSAVVISGTVIYFVGLIVVNFIDLCVRTLSLKAVYGVTQTSKILGEELVKSTNLPATVISMLPYPSYALYTLGALCGLLLTCFYSGRKGYNRDKIVFYLFYPLHMLLLYFIYVFIMVLLIGSV